MSGPVVKLKVTAVDNKVTVKPVTQAVKRVTIRVGQSILKVSGIAAGPRGSQGIAGATGPEGPTGPTGSGDLSFDMDFASQSIVTVNHNLGKYPSTIVLDTSGDLCEGDIDHQSKNTLVITFSAPFSGHITCN